MALARYRRPLLLALVLVLGTLVLAQRVRGGASAAPPPVAAPRAAVARPAALFVDVVGAVRRPGLYNLRQGTRVADAVHAAGGVTRKADLEAINLAAPLADGEQVLVPRRGAPSSAAAVAGGSASAAPVQLSVATAEQLDALPGIGPATAARIVAYRQEHGPFRSVDDLVGVPGIGPAKLAALKDLVVP
jgi:competence protein ComEA